MMLTNILSRNEFSVVIRDAANVLDFGGKLNKLLCEGGDGYVNIPDGTAQLLDVLQTMFEDEDDLITFYFTQMDSDGNIPDSVTYKTPGELWDHLVYNLRQKYGGD